MTMKITEYTNSDKTRVAKIHLNKETLSIEFIDNDVNIGDIEYPDKSMHYVESAARNFVDGIFKVDDVRQHL